MLALELGSELLQAGHVQVETARSDVVAAGQRDVCLTAPGQQRPEHRDRGAQATDEVVVGLVPDLVWDVDDQLPGCAFDLTAEAPQQLRHDVDVEDARDLSDRGAPGRE